MIWAFGFAALLAGLWTAFVFFANGMRSSPGKFVGAGTIWAAWLAVLIFAFMAFGGKAKAHDHNQPELDGWYKSLMQPDNPTVPCCGKADAYWCDDYYARDGRAYCKITDDRPDGPLGRPHIPVGTEIEIPPHKLKFDRGNPTGHSVAFVTRSLYLLCYVQGGGA